MESFPPCAADAVPIEPISMTKTAPVPISVSYTAEEFEQIKAGAFVEDIWAIFLKENVLHFVRARTRFTVYQLAFVETEDGFRTDPEASLANRDPEQYREDDNAYDAALAEFIINVILLRREVPFPMHERVMRANPPPKIVLLIQSKAAGTFVEEYYSWPKRGDAVKQVAITEE